jgi:hypothetical protein
MGVQARFWVSEAKQTTGADSPPAGGLIKLQAVGADENKQWSQYTPSGTIEISVTRPEAFEWFRTRLGKTIAITFDDVPEPSAPGSPSA